MIISLGGETAGERGEYNVTRWGLDGEGDDIGCYNVTRWGGWKSGR